MNQNIVPYLAENSPVVAALSVLMQPEHESAAAVKLQAFRKVAESDLSAGDKLFLVEFVNTYASADVLGDPNEEIMRDILDIEMSWGDRIRAEVRQETQEQMQALQTQMQTQYEQMQNQHQQMQTLHQQMQAQHQQMQAQQAQAIAKQKQTLTQLLQFRFTDKEKERSRFAQQIERLKALQPIEDLTNLLLNRESTLQEFEDALNQQIAPLPAQAESEAPGHRTAKQKRVPKNVKGSPRTSRKKE